ncbi:MAG: glycerol-3-phosphate dehydrogenase/oxidase [Promethearchaeota archaeon]|nr:MAG: glycerol-3-phosphate dehydrogenase/oxidase [Candidatus Lokiarchaeota archaeon]
MEVLEKNLFDQSWNFRNRDRIILNLRETKYDIIVIGAGITGAGVAREAAMRNLKVACIDMQDFSAGTSSRSSKMAHGGLRYITYGEMDLVKEATRERNWMRVHIPHLVRPIPFYLPLIEGEKYKKRDLTAAVKIYDFLSDDKSEFKNFKKHQWHSPEDIFELEPEFLREGNLGGVIYYDNNIDDARLTIEILKEAVIRGADVLNYCKAIGYIKKANKIVAVKCRDIENKREFEIKGTLVVNATGIWTDKLLENYPDDKPKPLIRPTKGVHLQYKRKNIQNKMANALYSPIDGRVYFVLPRNKDFTIIGTTDTDFDGDLANPFCTKEDADYLIKSTQKFYPNAKLGYENILSTYAGIRPLVMQKGKSESDVSRGHTIFFSEDGLLTITGGKLTEWRAMAEDLFDKIEQKGLFSNIERNKHFSRQPFIITLEKEIWAEELKKFDLNLDNDIADHLYQQYGKGTFKILEMIKQDESLSKKIIEENNFIKAEIIYCLRYEPTPHLIDVFCRRTEMSLWIDHRNALEAANNIAEIMANEYSWDENKKSQEIEVYMDYINKSTSFIT